MSFISVSPPITQCLSDSSNSEYACQIYTIILKCIKEKANCRIHPRYFEACLYRECHLILEEFIMTMKMENLRNV